jgi:hypothetical protein
MRMRTLFHALLSATSGRLVRLARRMDCSGAPVVLPRHYVRLIVCTWIADILADRVASGDTDN